MMSLLRPLWQLSDDLQLPDIIYFGFQEIVEMSAHQIISTDLNKRIIWEQEIINLLDSGFGPGTFRLLTSVSLVGILSIIAVRSDLLPFFRRVECFSRKVQHFSLII
jgi:synaptojanin